jgi:aspartate aminotransferase
VGEHQSLASNEAVYNQVITINGVSKAYAMTGWRIGYLAAPKEVTEACIKMQGQFTSGASSIAQRAALAAIKADPQVTHEMRDTFKKRRDFMLAELCKIEGFKLNEPEGAFYIFPEISSLIGKSNGDYKINSASDLCMYFLEAAHVAVVTGEAFGAPNYFRISYAASDAELAEAVKRLQEAVKKLS